MIRLEVPVSNYSVWWWKWASGGAVADLCDSVADDEQGLETARGEKEAFALDEQRVVGSTAGVWQATRSVCEEGNARSQSGRFGTGAPVQAGDYAGAESVSGVFGWFSAVYLAADSPSTSQPTERGSSNGRLSDFVEPPRVRDRAVDGDTGAGLDAA